MLTEVFELDRLRRENAGLKGENERLRQVFARAVVTYPQRLTMPRALEEWWAGVYNSFVKANQEVPAS